MSVPSVWLFRKLLALLQMLPPNLICCHGNPMNVHPLTKTPCNATACAHIRVHILNLPYFPDVPHGRTDRSPLLAAAREGCRDWKTPRSLFSKH